MPKRPRDEEFEEVEDDAEHDRRIRRRRTAETQDAQAAGTEEHPRPKRKKPKLTAAARERLRREDDETRAVRRHQAMVEWGGPLILTILGLGMTIVAGAFVTRYIDGVISSPLLVVVTAVWTLFLIPAVIAAVVFAGGVLAIDYGNLTDAARSLAAVAFFVNGIYCVGNLSLLGGAVAPLVAVVATFVLLMVFFRLNLRETITSLVVLNAILLLANLFFKLVVLTALAGGFSKRDRTFDDRPQLQKQGPFEGRNVPDRPPPVDD